MTSPIVVDAYFDSLLARASSAVTVPLMPIAYTEADFNNCHTKAETLNILNTWWSGDGYCGHRRDRPTCFMRIQ